MKQSILYVELFRVSTPEILEEVENRLLTGNRSQFTKFSNQELLQFVLNERNI